MYSRFKDDIWAADLAEIGSLYYFHEILRVKHLLCMMDFFKAKTVFNGFLRIVNESERKPNK